MLGNSKALLAPAFLTSPGEKKRELQTLGLRHPLVAQDSAFCVLLGGEAVLGVFNLLTL